MLVEYDNARILITDHKLESIKDVMGAMEAASKSGSPLVIIAEDITVPPPLLLGTTNAAQAIVSQASAAKSTVWLLSCLPFRAFKTLLVC